MTEGIAPRDWTWRVAAVALVCVAVVVLSMQWAMAGERPRFFTIPEDSALPWGTVKGRVVNFRAGPGLAYAVKFQLSRGCAVEVLGWQDGWYQVLRWQCPDPVWVCDEYLDVHMP